MDIRFVSSLTPDDELRVADGLIAILTGVLDRLPIAYTLRIESGSRVFQHTHSPSAEIVVDPSRTIISDSTAV